MNRVTFKDAFTITKGLRPMSSPLEDWHDPRGHQDVSLAEDVIEFLESKNEVLSRTLKRIRTVYKDYPELVAQIDEALEEADGEDDDS